MVLGYLPRRKLGGDMDISRPKAEAAVQQIAEALGKSLEDAAEALSVS